MKKEFPADWKAQVLCRVDEETGFTDVNGKQHFSPMYTWVEGLFSNPANDEKWAQLTKRLPLDVLADALEVCRRALFSFPLRKFPWNSPAAISKARKNAQELAAFLRKWDSVPWAAMPWVAETAKGLEGLVVFLERAGNPVQQLADGKFEVGGIIVPEKPGQGRRPVDPFEPHKRGRATPNHWRVISMLDKFFRKRFGPTHPKQEATALLLSIMYPHEYTAEQVKRTLRTIKKKKAAPTPTPAHW